MHQKENWQDLEGAKMASVDAELQTKYIIDTSFWINYFSDPLNPKLNQVFEVGPHYTPTIVLGEFKNIYVKNNTPGFKVHLAEIHSKSQIIDLDEKMAIRGGEIRGSFCMKLGKKKKPSIADCIILAYTEEIKSTKVLSTDLDFKQFPNTVVIEKEKLRGG